MSGRASELLEKLGGLKYALFAAAVGLAMMLWPSGTGGKDAEGSPSSEELRLAALLTQIEGVGRTEVLLSESGAAVVIEGAEESSVRLAVTQAVRCYTGLGANEVTIFKMDE